MSDNYNNSISVLQAKGISKSFPGVRALDNVDLTLRSGRLTALLGENGAGKSTLMNIIAGVFPPDTGEIWLSGEKSAFLNPRAARDSGISMIHQELNLIPDLNIAENIFLGREPLNRFGFIDYKLLYEKTVALLEMVELNLDPITPLKQLRVGQQQLVEIAKAVSTNARVLIMDEPTSAITEHEIEVLFRLIDQLKRQGVAIAYITHKLDELTRIGDDAIVMRDGKLITAAPLTDLQHDDIVKMMVGRELASSKPRLIPGDETRVLRVDNLSLRHPERERDFVFKDVSFEVNRGEILGIFGLMGAGRTELLETLFGLHPARSSGSVFLNDASVKINSPERAVAMGFAFAPEDRKQEAIIPGMSIKENACLANLKCCEKYGVLLPRSELKLAQKVVQDFGVKAASVNQAICNLSGGNQQKVILGKWLATQPLVLLLDEPTRGIDVNAKAEIYALIRDLAQQGLSVIFVSSELPEVLMLAGRILVMCEGRLTAEFDQRYNDLQLDEQTILKAALPRRKQAS